ncbi:DUF3168 domain-containing protein [Methylobacterium fujisawaense]|uniref:DUF3168 domain-containing protein n=1 Tax=Methylobacterium fujisawaense TaxID=107400 RepID=UPI00313BFB1A
MALATTFELALRDAIRTRLKSDGAFQALAGKQIFDEVPSSLGEIAPKVKPPYAYFGPIRRSNKVLDCSESWTIQARLYAVSTTFNRDQGWLLIDAMVASLDQLEGPDLPLADPYSLRTPLVVGQAGDVIDPLQAKSVFFDLTTSIARPLPGQED